MRDTLPALKKELERRERIPFYIAGFKRAAVLVPILDAPGGLELLYTVRSSKLSNHAGQISFPGGRLDDGETVNEGAVRETWEEIGVRVDPKNILGHLDDHPSPASYTVTPVVAVLEYPQPLVLNEAEVAEVFTVPVAKLLELEPRSEERQLKQYRRTLHFYDYQDGDNERIIWGLTGNVTKYLLDIIRGLD